MNIGKTGEKGEKLAARFLEKKGYTIIAKNFQTRFGEIDIICRNKEYLVFAEVKTRSGQYLVSGRDAALRLFLQEYLRSLFLRCGYYSTLRERKKVVILTSKWKMLTCVNEM